MTEMSNFDQHIWGSFVMLKKEGRILETNFITIFAH